MNGTKSFRAKEASADGSFSAVIATLGVPDRDGDVIAPGAFSGRPVFVVPSHDQTHIPIGKVRVQERGHEAVAVGAFNLKLAAGRDWLSWLRFDLANGRPLQEWSFAFDVLEFDPLAGGGRRIRKLSEIEVSPVLRGAGVGTRTTCAGETCKSSGTVRGKGCDCGCSGSGLSVAGVVAEAVLALDKADAAMVEAGGDCRVKLLPAPTWIESIARDAAEELGIPAPPVKSFRRARLDEHGPDVVRLRGSMPFGFYDPETKTAYVRADLSRVQTADTTAHECHHAFEDREQRLYVGKWGAADSEQRASDFGSRFARRFA